MVKRKWRKANESHNTEKGQCRADKIKDAETKASNGYSGALLEYGAYVSVADFYPGFEFCIDPVLSDPLSFSFHSTWP